VRSRKQGPHTLGGAVNAISAPASDPRGRFLLGCGALTRPLGLGQGHGTGLFGGSQGPEDPAADHGRQVDVVCQPVAMLCIGQDLRGQGQTTPGAHHDQTLRANRTAQARAGHRRARADDRAPLHTAAAVSGQQRMAGARRAHRAVTQDDVRQDRDHRLARRTLDTPDGEPTQPDTDIMGVAWQPPAAATGGLLGELKPAGQDERSHPFDQGLAVAKPLHVGRFVLEMAGEGPVVSRRVGRCAPGAPPGPQVSSVDETRWGSRVAISRPS
jgi:hypothetical protein